MSPVTIFLREGQVFALTVPAPKRNVTKYIGGTLTDPIEKYPGADRDMEVAYELALASARESAVRVQNDLRADNIWVEIMEEGKLYSLPSEYKMRVESQPIPYGHGLPPDDCMETVATIYRDEPKATETPLSALRNKLSPFINLAEMVKDTFHTIPPLMKNEANKCDTDEVNRLLSELETPKEETQDDLWDAVMHIHDDPTMDDDWKRARLNAKFILTRKEGVTH